MFLFLGWVDLREPGLNILCVCVYLHALQSDKPKIFHVLTQYSTNEIYSRTLLGSFIIIKDIKGRANTRLNVFKVSGRQKGDSHP